MRGSMENPLPPLSTEQFEALRLSIKAEGVRHPVLKTESGRVLDGNHRLKIDRKAPVEVVKGSRDWTDAQCAAYAIRVNLDRRQLSPDQRKELRRTQRKIARQLKGEGKTQREIAESMGMARQTVADWLDDTPNAGSGNGSFAQSMRDDLGISNIVPMKVALTGEQVQALNLPPNLTAKKTSSRRKRFVEQHGEHVFELEAIPPATLQRYLREAIDSVIDLDAYNAEVDREKSDAAFLDTVRGRAHAVLANLGAD